MDKKLLIAILLSLGTVWLFNYYYSGKKGENPSQELAPGQPFKVPTAAELQKPLALDVQFVEKKFTEPEQVVDVETTYLKASFSTYGAILTSLDFKGHPGKNGSPLRTVYNKGTYEPEQRKKGCFLLAMQDQTPYQYVLEGKHEAENKINVVFSTTYEQWTLKKTYVFYQDSYQLDVVLGFEPKDPQATPIKPRLMYAAPFVGEVEEDGISILAWDEQRQGLDAVESSKVDGAAWFWTIKQIIFGAQDRYFVHALINDQSNFVQRAYVKQFDNKNIFPIISQQKSDLVFWIRAIKFI